NRANPIDKAVADYFYANNNKIVEEIMDVISDLGESFVYMGILIVLYYIWDKKKAYRGMVGVITSVVVNSVAKSSFRLDKPNTTWGYDLDTTTYGMPSGHAQVSTTFWGLLGALFTKKRYESDIVASEITNDQVEIKDQVKIKPSFWKVLGTFFRKWGMAILAIILPLLIAFSRIYLGVHWLTDVTVAIGIGVLILAIYLLVEEPIEDFMEKQSGLVKTLFALLMLIVFSLPVILLQYNLGQVGIENIFSDMNVIALIVTISISYIWEEKLVNFSNEVDKKWKIVVRILFALAIVGLVVAYDAIYDPDVITTTKMIVDLIIYIVIGPIMILLIPWVIKKLNV
ncbi:MAG: phosphatase PAP2 family protein, partial [Promethearchaeota archaeon]